MNVKFGQKEDRLSARNRKSDPIHLVDGTRIISDRMGFLGRALKKHEDLPSMRKVCDSVINKCEKEAK